MKITRRLRLEKDIIDTVVRVLPGKGKLNIQMGQEVTPDEIIGTATLSSGFRIINVASILGVKPGEVEKYLNRKVGQKIYRGELLAYKKGLFNSKKVVVSPTDGEIDLVDLRSGEVKVNFLPRKINLPSGVFGVVGFVDRLHAKVAIRTQVTKLYGVFGSGRSREGNLRLLKPNEELISATTISPEEADQVLVGRNLIYKEAISAAISSNVSGIITGGINASDYRGMAGGYLAFPRRFDNDVGISVVVCEGFGSVPIGGDIFSLLQEHEGKFVLIDGNSATVSLPSDKSDCILAVRRAALPPSMGAGVKETTVWEEDIANLKVGDNIRMAGVTYLGEQGRIAGIDQSKTRLPSGVWSNLILVETKYRKIKIPVTNIELI